MSCSPTRRRGRSARSTVSGWGTRAPGPGVKPAPTPSATAWRGCWARWSRSSLFLDLDSPTWKRSSIGASACSCVPIPPVRRCRFGADRGAGHADSPRRLGRHHGWGVHAPAQMPRFHELLEQRLDRLARRMAEAELDAPAFLGSCSRRPPTPRSADSGCMRRPMSSCRSRGLRAAQSAAGCPRSQASAAGSAPAVGSSVPAAQGTGVSREDARTRRRRPARGRPGGRPPLAWNNDVTPPPEPAPERPDAMGESRE